MEDFEKQLKKNGMLLKSIPSKERTAEQCKIAVHQNPKALKLVPYKLQEESLCKYALKKDPSVYGLISPRKMSEKLCLYAVKLDASLLELVDKQYKTEKVCRAALAGSIEVLRFVPKDLRNVIYPEATEELVCSCVAWIRKDISASAYMPECVKSNHDVLNYQKEQHCLSEGFRYYDAEAQKFCAKLEFRYQPDSDDSRPIKYQILAQFDDFDEYYHFLNENLDGAILRTCKFEGIDLHKYNIQGAVIHSDVLVEQGLYDDTYFRSRIATAPGSDDSPTEKNEIALQQDFHYLKPVDDDGHMKFEMDKIPVFYVSDIHLWHRVNHRFKERATKEEAHLYIQAIVERMIASIGTVPYNSFLLIAGDTSDLFEYEEVFYTKLVKHWRPERIVVISGNHELWDPEVDMDENIRIHREFFARLGINYLQNDLLCVEDDALNQIYLDDREWKRPFVLNENEILTLSPEEIHERLCKCPLLILGGIGFSGLNEEYNAINLRYGCSFDNLPHEEAREKEISESQRFDVLYRKLMESVAGNRLIVLTHMRKDDWSEAPYIPCWTYINGHNHRNYYEVNDQRKIYADNQIGYHTENVGLKYFYTDNEYDIFANYADGIYEISTAQYTDFNRGKRIYCNFSRSGIKIHMLKKNGQYMFLYYGKYSPNAKRETLYLLNGGNMRKLDRSNAEDIRYYYDSLDQYAGNVHKLIDRYTGAQERLSQFIKNLGGSGRIHGCIVDVDMPAYFGGFSYTHVFVNPIDGTVTPYFAWDVKSRTVYKDFRSLLENNGQCKKMLANYKKLEAKNPSNLPALRYGTAVAEWGEDDSVYDEGGYLYQMSRIIKSLQYCSEKDIIRIWNENLLNHDFIQKVMISGKAEDAMDGKLISE